MKGQYFSFDVVVASLMFVLALVTLFSFWAYITQTSNQNLEFLRKEAIRISYLLISDSPNMGIIEDPLTHRLISLNGEVDKATIAERIRNANSTTRFCIQVDYFDPTTFTYSPLSDYVCKGKPLYTFYRGVRVVQSNYEFGTVLRIVLHAAQTG